MKTEKPHFHNTYRVQTELVNKCDSQNHLTDQQNMGLHMFLMWCFFLNENNNIKWFQIVVIVSGGYPEPQLVDLSPNPEHCCLMLMSLGSSCHAALSILCVMSGTGKEVDATHVTHCSVDDQKPPLVSILRAEK